MWSGRSQTKRLSYVEPKRLDAEKDGEVSASCVQNTPTEQDDVESETDKEPVVVAKCCVCGSSENIQCCGNCEVARYCSKGCQREHWAHHSV